MLETEGWIEFQTAMNLLANTTGSLLIARRDLVNSLKDGRIQSAATKKIRHPKTDEVMFEHDYLLEPLRWDMDQLLARLSSAIDAQDKLLPDEVRESSPSFTISMPEDVRIWEKDFVKEFPLAGQVSSRETHREEPEVSKLRSGDGFRSKGGRPIEYDWPGAVIEMARVALLEEDCDRPALARAVKDWFSKSYDQEPADSSIRALVKRFHESIWPPKT